MYYIKPTNKPFAQAVSDLEEQVVALGFGVLHVHNIGETLRSKGQDFSQECKVLEVCNPKHANTVMTVDMRLNMALPCRISVYSENSKIFIGMIKPDKMLASLSDNPQLQAVAQEVEEKTMQMIDNAC